MATKKTAKVAEDTKEVAADAPVEETPKITRTGNWRDPNFKPVQTDNSIDARMKRLTDEIRPQ